MNNFAFSSPESRRAGYSCSRIRANTLLAEFGMSERLPAPVAPSRSAEQFQRAAGLAPGLNAIQFPRLSERLEREARTASPCGLADNLR